MDLENIVTCRTINGRNIPHLITKAFLFKKNLYLITDKNEIIINDHIIESNLPIENLFLLNDEVYYVTEFSLRKIINKKFLNEKKICYKSNEIRSNVYNQYNVELIKSKKIIVLKSLILKTMQFNDMIFIASENCFIVYYNKIIYYLKD